VHTANSVNIPCITVSITIKKGEKVNSMGVSEEMIKEEEQKKKNVCPKIDICQERISEHAFRTKCIGNPNDCPLNWKRPKQWLKELTVEK
jgi:hypothetical protein